MNRASVHAEPSRKYDTGQIHARLPDLADIMATRWGVLTSSPRGADTPTECPEHRPGHTRSGSVRRWPNGRQTFKCWRGCTDKARDIIQLLQDVDGLTIKDAIATAASFSAVSASEANYQPAPRQARRLRPVKIEPLVLDAQEQSETAVAELSRYLEHRCWPQWVAELYQLSAVQRGGHRRIRHPFLDTKGQTLGAQDYGIGLNPRWQTVKGSKACLYGQPNLVGLDSTMVLDVCEGVSDTISITAALGKDHPVIGVPGSCGWRPQYSAGLKACHLVVWPDNDEAGSKFAAAVMATHGKAAGQVSIGKVPDEYGDLGDWQAGASEFAGDFRAARFAAWKDGQ